MSDLSELIEINRNIEKQNKEIIRLLKKIAGEEEADDKHAHDREISKSFINSIVKDFVDSGIVEEENNDVTDDEPSSGLPLDAVHEPGEVVFVEGEDIFRLTVKNNETTVDNLTSSNSSNDFKLQELIANESITKNQSLSNSTVILNESQSKNLDETLRFCVENGAKTVYVPLSESKQLMWTLDAVRTKINVEFYKDDEYLINKLFD